MTILNKLDKKLTQVGSSVVYKTQSMTENMRVKNEIDEEKRKIKHLYAEIGRKFACTLTAENIPEEYRQIYDMVTDSEQKIIKIRTQITAQGVAHAKIRCPVCHAQIPADSVFCNSCGANMTQAAARGQEISAQFPAFQTPREDNCRNTCTNCGAPLKDGQIFCINCGSKVGTSPLSEAQHVDASDKTEIITPEPVQAEMEESLSKCPSCGAELGDGQVFCINCGTKVKE